MPSPPLTQSLRPLAYEKPPQLPRNTPTDLVLIRGAIGRGGRPKKQFAPSHLWRMGIEYIAKNEAKGEPLTITGLAMALGVGGKDGLKELEGKERVATIVRVLRAYIVHRYEQRLHSRVPTGAQFALKNIDGWRDTQELEVAGRLNLSALLKEARELREKGKQTSQQ